MAGKRNLPTLRRIQYRKVEETLTDPLQPGVEVLVRLTGMSLVERDYAEARGKEWAGEFVHGDTPYRRQPGNEVVTLTEDVCRVLSWTYHSQEDWEGALCFEDLVEMVLDMPRAWIRLQQIVVDLISNPYEGNAGNA